MTRILFVCTGNTCRSPMAKCLMEALCRRQGLTASCDSAGLHVLPGTPASPGAQRAMANRGLSLQGHRAKRLNASLCENADVILCMTPGHLREFSNRFPEHAKKAQTFLQPVSDPFGGSDSYYEQIANQISRLLEEWLLEHPLD